MVILQFQTNREVGASFCSGSLISKRWVVSATHCIGKSNSINIENCEQNGLKCRKNRYGDFIIKPQVNSAIAHVYINVEDYIVEQVDMDKKNELKVRKIIRPKKAYPGDTYGVRKI